MTQTYQVSTLAGLYDALAKAKGGETILLKAGNYGDMSLSVQSKFDYTFASNVTIASADPLKPAVLTGLDIRGAENLTFDAIKFDYTFARGDEIYERPFSVSGSQNITIRNSTFDGDVATGVSTASEGFGYGIGLSFRGSTSVKIENNEFFNFHRGLGVSESSNIVVSGNDLHSIRMDGMNFSEVTKIAITENYIHDFKGSPTSLDHCDMIQFWTNGTDNPSSDITIRGNYLDIGNGTATQSIFMRNEVVDKGLAGPEMFYRNVTIEDNVIVNAHLHGITVGETTGLAIRNNTVLHADGRNVDGADDSVEIPQIRVSAASTQVAIVQNAVATIVGPNQQPGWTVTKNAFVQDRDSAGPGFYGDVFIASSMDAPGGVHNFKALQGGMLDRLDAGATATLAPSGPGVVAAFHVETVPGNQAFVRFDASHSQIDAKDLPANTQFLWTFGDGTKAKGEIVDHPYMKGGKYDVTLTVILPDGRRDSQSLTVATQSEEVVSFVKGRGFVVNEYGTEQLIVQESTASANGLVLGKTGIVAEVDHVFVDRLLGQEAFNMSLSLAATKSGSAGEIMRLHGSFVASVTTKGEVFLDINTDGGNRIVLTTTGAHVSDIATHDIGITLRDGILSVTVDGTVRGRTEMSGGLADLGNRDLTFGNPWGKQNFEGILKDFDMSVNGDDFAAARTAANLSKAQVDTPVAPQVEESAANVPSTQDASHKTILDYDTGKGFAVKSTDAAALLLDVTDTAKGIDLGGKGVAVSVARSHVDDILGSDNFEIGMTLKADKIGSAGEVVRLHSSFLTGVNAKGEFDVQVFSTEEGRIRLSTDGARLNDGKEHDVSLTLNNGVLSINVDGRVLAKTAMTGELVSEGRHNLSFGNAWGKDNFDGHISDFTVAMKDNASTAEPAAVARTASESITAMSDYVIPQHDLNMTFDAQSGYMSAYL